MDPIDQAINQGINQGIPQGASMGFEWIWWVIPLAIAFVLFEKWANKKIDNRNWRRRNKRRNKEYDSWYK